MTTEAATKEISALTGRLKDRCFLCKWIFEDVEAHGKLTDYPLDFNGHGVFPVEGKERHLALESGSIDNLIV